MSNEKHDSAIFRFVRSTLKYMSDDTFLGTIEQINFRKRIVHIKKGYWMYLVVNLRKSFIIKYLPKVLKVIKNIWIQRFSEVSANKIKSWMIGSLKSSFLNYSSLIVWVLSIMNNELALAKRDKNAKKLRALRKYEKKARNYFLKYHKPLPPSSPTPIIPKSLPDNELEVSKEEIDNVSSEEVSNIELHHSETATEEENSEPSLSKEKESFKENFLTQNFQQRFELSGFKKDITHEPWSMVKVYILVIANDYALSKANEKILVRYGKDMYKPNIYNEKKYYCKIGERADQLRDSRSHGLSTREYGTGSSSKYIETHQLHGHTILGSKDIESLHQFEKWLTEQANSRSEYAIDNWEQADKEFDDEFGD